MVNTSFPSISKNGGVFLGSLGFAFLLWFLFYFSRDYSEVISLPIQLYTHYNGSIQKNSRLSLIQVRVQGRGWLITQYDHNKEKEPILISGDYSHQSILHLKPFLSQINKGLPAGLQVVEIKTDSISLQKRDEISKKVPLHLGFQISFQKQYYFSGLTRIHPDSVMISGPRSIIRNLSSWKLPNVQLNNLNKSLDTNIRLLNNSIPEVSVNPVDAQVQIHIDRFTENVISLPIKILNNEEGLSINLIPSHVEVSYLVPLSYFTSVREELFEVQVDLNQWKRNHRNNQLTVKLVRFPDFIRIIKISPTQEDFIIYP